MKLLQLLDNPKREFTPIPFWFLNGNLTKKEIRRQLKDFVEHGVYGVVIHPRMGLPKHIDYLGERFFYYIREAVKVAAELEMQVVLYDEGMYPSGSACGLVVQNHPELASEGITVTKKPESGDEILAWKGQEAVVVRKSGGTLRGIHWGEDDGEVNAPLSADILNPEAVNRFIQLTHERYFHELKEYFGTVVIGFFTDEPSVLGRNVRGMFPWTRGFSKDFLEAGGKFEELFGLFCNKKNSSIDLYYKMILKREEEIYYKSLSDWCKNHGIALMGHPHQSDDIEMEKYFHIPGQDLVLRWIAPETGGVTGIDSTMAKCSADAARIMKCRRNSNECFGACNQNGNSWQLSGGDIKWYLDWLAVRGVNLFIPHAFYYSIAGKRKEERPPDVGPNSIWWPYYRQWAGYMSRLSCLMTEGILLAKVAVLCCNRELKPEVVKVLFENQISFQYLPESVWKECKEENTVLSYEGVDYTMIVGEKNQFPSIPHLDLTGEQISESLRDCTCIPACPNLRTAHFIRLGTTCWFLVNEGNESLRTEVAFSGSRLLGRYDLWRGKAYQITSEVRNSTTYMQLKLAPRESILVFSCSLSEYQKLPILPENYQIPCPEFVLKQHDRKKIQKIYEADLNVSKQELLHPYVTISIEAEEMAELFINEKFVGAAFWSPHVFELTKFLEVGKNKLRLVVTGNMANRYGKIPVFYGLASEKEEK